MNKKNPDPTTNSNFLNQYLDKRVLEKTKKAPANWVINLFCILLYLTIMFIQGNVIIADYVNGILSQLGAIITVYLVIKLNRLGYFTGLLLNTVNLISILIAVLQLNKTTAITGLIVVIFTMVSISIIYFLVHRYTKQYSELLKQKEELITMSEEIAASEEELRQQNEQLFEYNEVIRNNEEKLNYLAFFDTLTELPNRKMILDRLELMVNLSQKNKSSFALVFIDLDDFKIINDSMGHHIGDQLINAVAIRLGHLVYKEDILGRLGGDEFAVIIQRELKDEGILQYVDDLRQSLEDQFVIDGSELSISASFGISIYPYDGKTSNELVKCADTALYKIKENGKNGIFFFRKEMQEEILRRIDFENKMSVALQQEEFFLVFQPQYHARNTQLRGFEALIRWQSPELGLLSPAKFIQVAEETGFIIPLGQWVLSTACRLFKEIIQRYQLNDAILSVNISAIQFDDLSLIPAIKHVLKESGLPAQNLELEITESVLIKSLDQAIINVKELKKIGVKIALDDFGTGYSSLRYLQLLPIDTLKIDKTFVDNIDQKEKNFQIIGAIINLVHQMDIYVMAEGVENEGQLSYLQQAECDGIQGYLLAKPMPVSELYKKMDQSISA